MYIIHSSCNGHIEHTAFLCHGVHVAAKSNPERTIFTPELHYVKASGNVSIISNKQTQLLVRPLEAGLQYADNASDKDYNPYNCC